MATSIPQTKFEFLVADGGISNRVDPRHGHGPADPGGRRAVPGRLDSTGPRLSRLRILINPSLAAYIKTGRGTP